MGREARPALPDATVKHHALASLYVAAVTGLAATADALAALGPAALLVGLFGAIIAFFCAFIVSIPLLYARSQLGEWSYMLLHAAVGLTCGGLFAAQSYPGGAPWLLFASSAAVLVNTASLAGWLYVVLFVPPGIPGNLDIRPRARRFASAILVIGVLLLPIPFTLAPSP